MNVRAKRAAQRGVTITEIVISLGILSTLCLLVAQWFAVTAIQQARYEEQRYSSQTATNLMEQLFALSWDELTEEKGDGLAASAAEAAADYECSAEITDVPPDESGLRCKRISVRVAHRQQRIAPMELMAWRHAREDGT